MKDLIQVFHQIESTATIPQQWSTSLIEVREIERPIALVATLLYRSWCRLRNPYTKQWQTEIKVEYPWERAVPGTECLQVALKRAFMTEHHHAPNKTVIYLHPPRHVQLLRQDQPGWLDSDYPATWSSGHPDLLWSPHPRG